MKYAISVKWLANPNEDHSHFSQKIGAHLNISLVIKVKILVLTTWS